MDKCIKVELPTGHVLLEFDEDLNGYFAATEEYEQLIDNYIADVSSSYGCCMQPSNQYDDWVCVWIAGDMTHFKVIAQYGDEFPV